MDLTLLLDLLMQCQPPALLHMLLSEVSAASVLHKHAEHVSRMIKGFWLLQKYRLYLKRLAGVSPGGKGKGGRMTGLDSNFALLHAHAGLPLGVPGNYPNMPGVRPCILCEVLHWQ